MEAPGLSNEEKAFNMLNSMISMMQSRLNPADPIVGGLLLALCVAAITHVLGRVLGVSGFVNYVIGLGVLAIGGRRSDDETTGSVLGSNFYKICFPIGLMISGIVCGSVDSLMGGSAGSNLLETTSGIATSNEKLAFIVTSGFLVGLGSSLANGCTSGHGLCGLSRGSKRSIVAIMLFFGTALLTRGFLRKNLLNTDHIWMEKKIINWVMSVAWFKEILARIWIPLVGMTVSLLLTLLFSWWTQSNSGGVLIKGAFSLFVGILFGQGLAISGMTDWKSILSFLDLPWTAFRGDPSMAFVFAAALIPISISYFAASIFMEKPLAEDRFALPLKTRPVDWRLVVGGILFGAGWAMCGLCPGPALALLFPDFSSLIINPDRAIFKWWVGYTLGSLSSF